MGSVRGPLIAEIFVRGPNHSRALVLADPDFVTAFVSLNWVPDASLGGLHGPILPTEQLCQNYAFTPRESLIFGGRPTLL